MSPLRSGLVIHSSWWVGLASSHYLWYRSRGRHHPHRVSATILLGLFMTELIRALVQRSFWDAHNGILGLILNLALSQTLTIFIKVRQAPPAKSSAELT